MHIPSHMNFDMFFNRGFRMKNQKAVPPIPCKYTESVMNLLHLQTLFTILGVFFLLHTNILGELRYHNNEILKHNSNLEVMDVQEIPIKLNPILNLLAPFYLNCIFRCPLLKKLYLF